MANQLTLEKAMRLSEILIVCWFFGALEADNTSSDNQNERSSPSSSSVTWSLFLRRLRNAAFIEACRHGSPSPPPPPPPTTEAPLVRCVCESGFTGERCQHLNMTTIGQVVLGGTVVLHWERPPRLRGFSLVFQEATNSSGPAPGSTLRKSAIVMKDDARTLLLENLRGGGTSYWVCIEEDRVADDAVSTQRTDQLANCLYVSTLPDYDSMAGWALALLLSALTVLLIYLQRDKIELLYFSRPMPGYYEPVQQENRRRSEEEEEEAEAEENGGSTIRLPRTTPVNPGTRPWPVTDPQGAPS